MELYNLNMIIGHKSHINKELVSMNRKTNLVLGVIFVASIAVIIGSLSYAYFSLEIGEVKNQELSITSGTMRLTFSDNDSGFNGALNFGESAEKLFILENTGTLPVVGKINFVDMINTYLDGSLTYKLDYKTSEESTTWIEVLAKKNVPQSSTPITKALSKNIELPVGAKYYYRLTIILENLAGVDQTADINASFSSTFNITEGITESSSNSPFDEVIANANSGNPNFVTAATTDEGIYALEDDFGTSYYYRGTSQTNYLKYGKNKDGQDMYWRIIRINGDGSLRIIYDGTQAYTNGIANETRYAKVGQGWNTQYRENKYVGYMFGGAQGEASTSKEQAQKNETSCDAKVAVDAWYKENIIDTGYGTNVIDAIFCNDRSTPGEATTGLIGDTGLGYGKNATGYGVTARAGVWKTDNVAPKFTCEVKNDAFTVNESEKGNGALTYPVGLITADEILAAGSGKYATANSSYYLYKSSNYYGLSLSPCNMNQNGLVYLFVVTSGGALNYVDRGLGAIAPVINLSAEYASELIGDGTITNPYRAEGVEP